MPEEETPAGEPLPTPVVLALVLLLTALLTVWSAFLVPLRVRSVPVPVWLVLLGAALALGTVAGRRLGLVGALPPALLWFGLSWLAFGSTRPEGDIVVPGSGAGHAYLFGGLLLWLVVCARAGSPVAPEEGAGSGAPQPATPRARTRR